MWEIFEHIIEHTLIDTLKMLPFLLAAYIFIEYIEHKSSNRLVQGLRRFGILGGAVLGCLPQCGFSVAASNLYSGRIITAGTLIAVFISTSDEAIPILLSNPGHLSTIALLIGVKVALAIVAGLMADYVFKGFFSNNEKEKIASAIHSHVCTDCGCDEDHGIIKPALKHTLNIFIFVLVTTLVLNIFIEFAGEDTYPGFFSTTPCSSRPGRPYRPYTKLCRFHNPDPALH